MSLESMSLMPNMLCYIYHMGIETKESSSGMFRLTVVSLKQVLISIRQELLREHLVFLPLNPTLENPRSGSLQP